MAGLIEQDAPRARLAALLQHFSDLDDSREPWRVMYPLREVLLLVTCATIASCDDFDEIADWGEHNIDFLRRFSDYHHGIPCERWLRSLFNRVDPTLFAPAFAILMDQLKGSRHPTLGPHRRTDEPRVH